MKTKAIVFTLLAVLLVLFATPVYAGDNIPPLPHAFYGTVEVNGDPAPAGTEVEARGEEIQTNVGNNPIVVVVEGSYGSSSPLEPKLIAQGNIADGATLTFYVNGVSTGQTVEWHSGEITELSLTVTIEGPPPGATDVSDIISNTGVFINRVEAGSSDSLCRLIVDGGTVGLTKDNEALAEIKMVRMGAPPAPPAGVCVVGSVYDFKPDGATFNPTVTLEYTYDPAKIPDGVAEEELILAWWDSSVSAWAELNSTINPETNIITAPVNHFTAFAVLVYEPPEPIPATFNLGSLAISPNEVAIGESVTISVQITNTGEEVGNYEATLKINDVVETSKRVVVNAGASQEVTFTTTKDSVGTYTVDVNGLNSTFVVTGEAQTPDESVVSSPVPSTPEPSPPAPPLPPSPSTPSASPIDWPALLIVIAGVSAMGMMIPLLVKRKKRPRYWRGPGPWDK